jgi:hypothetical protein
MRGDTNNGAVHDPDRDRREAERLLAAAGARSSREQCAQADEAACNEECPCETTTKVPCRGPDNSRRSDRGSSGFSRHDEKWGA